MLFTSAIHRNIHLLAIATIICSLPFSVFTTSVGIITLLVNFLLEGDWKSKQKNLSQNKLVWVLILLYLPVLYSSFYSADFSTALKELRLWLPFLLVPPVFAMSNSINKKEFRTLLLLFTLTTLVATIISFSHWIFVQNSPADNIRQISLFISHIRFALMINLGIAILVHFIIIDSYFGKYQKVFFTAILLWMISFQVILQSVTGLIMLLLMFAIGTVWIFIKYKSSISRFVIATIGFTLLFILVSFLTHRVDKFYTRNVVDFTKLPNATINGNLYVHDSARLVYENGNMVYINICSSELKKEWEARSELPYDGTDKKGQQLSQTLIRYITSLGLTKDSVGVWILNNDDISLIESGVTSVVFKESRLGVNRRIYELLWEIDSYINEGTIENSSFIQRVVYFKASLYVISKNFWFGVGWGDVLQSLNEYYTFKKINLSEKFRFMPHNQYLTVWVGAGFVGLVIFLVALLVPFFVKRLYKYFLSLYFFVMIMISMLNEDTFETHIGITFAVIFGSLFIFGSSYFRNTDEPESTKS